MNTRLIIGTCIILLSLLIGALSLILTQPKPVSTEPTQTPKPTSTLSAEPTASPTEITYACEVVKAYPHDTNAFTEGLVYADNLLYESTGLYGYSSLRRVNPTTGKVLQETTLPSQFFGEGIAIFDDKILQLTWLENTGFVYEKETLTLLSNFTYPTEGWGLTYDGVDLIMSDGSNRLYFLDPDTHELISEIQVHDVNNNSINNLNELEYIKGMVYANIFEQEVIAIINPQTGQVSAWIDLTNLNDPAGVPNGIAYDVGNDRLFLTGKNWRNLYEVKLVPQS